MQQVYIADTLKNKVCLKVHWMSWFILTLKKPTKYLGKIVNSKL